MSQSRSIFDFSDEASRHAAPGVKTRAGGNGNANGDSKLRRSRLIAILTTLPRILPRLVLPVVLIVYVVWGARVVPGWRWQMNPDGTGYLAVAHKYLSGHFADAVNAYWSPLYSWLLVPLIGGGVEQWLATKVLAVAIGAGALSAAWWLMANLGVTRDVRAIVSVTLIPILLYFGMVVTTPDLLVASAIVLYLAQLTSPRYLEKWRSAVVTGALMALAYFAKAYSLPLVVAHFGLMSLVWFWRSKGQRRHVLAMSLIAYVTLALLAGAWATALTHKYGYVTFGTTGRFNLAWNGPKFALPISQGFLPPPDGQGFSSWDDASYYDVATWNPLGTPAEREHFAANRARNWNQIVTICLGFTWLFWPLVVVGVMLAGTGAEPSSRRPGLAIVLALALYPLGYYCLHVESRFLEVMCMLLLLIGAFAIGRAAAAFRIDPVRRLGAAAFLCASFLLSAPTWTIGKDDTRPPMDRYSLKQGWGTGHEMSVMSEKLAGLLPPRAKIASVGSWDGTLYLATCLDLSYFGEAKSGESPDAIRADLQRLGVQYLFVWGDPRRLPFTNQLTEISGGRVAGLSIYRL